MGLSRTLSEINGDFIRKSQNFPNPHDMYFAPPLTGFPLELGIGTWSQKNKNDAATIGQKSFKIGLAV